MTTDPVVVAGASGRLHSLAIAVQALGQYELANAIERESRMLARPSRTTGCKGCGGSVPEVPNGRPRLHCHACRPPRTKPDTKAPESATVDPMRNARKHETLVPILELWQAGHGVGANVSLIPGRLEEQSRFIADTYDVAVELDYFDRPCVSLDDAYKIRDLRKKAAQELQDASLAELIEAGRIGEWQKARAEFWRHNLPEQGRLHPIGAGPRGADAGNVSRQALADQCVAAEHAAGIPEDVQQRLTWPLWNVAMAYDDRRDPYQPPTF